MIARQGKARQGLQASPCYLQEYPPSPGKPSDEGGEDKEDDEEDNGDGGDGDDGGGDPDESIVD